jgi:predicted DNA-binding transcriptional regulator AlpA
MNDPLTAIAPNMPPLALSADGVTRLLGISTRHLWSLNSSGRLPRPIRFGRATRWRANELRDWLAAGAPPRDRWEAQCDRAID